MKEKNIDIESLKKAVGGFLTDDEGNQYYMDYGINPDHCVCCGNCIDSCPIQCIEIKGDSAVIDSNVCLHCGYCTENCPTDAIGYNRKTIVYFAK